MKEQLDVNWLEVLKNNYAEEHWTLLLDKITKGVDKYVPKTTSSSKSSHNTHDEFPIIGKLKEKIQGRVAQSVTCLATIACMTADPGVASSILAQSHTFVEIDHEIISTVILLPSSDSFKKGCCWFQAKVCAQITG